MGLALLGDKLPAEQAAEWGLIWQMRRRRRAVPSVAATLARSSRSAPTRGSCASKRGAATPPLATTLEAQLDLERDLQRELGHSDDYREGVAAFIDKRAAALHRTARHAWRRRLPAKPIVAVIGAGAMGAGIAQIAAQSGPSRAAVRCAHRRRSTRAKRGIADGAASTLAARAG